jgi:hypothetical protein
MDPSRESTHVSCGTNRRHPRATMLGALQRFLDKRNLPRMLRRRLIALHDALLTSSDEHVILLVEQPVKRLGQFSLNQNRLPNARTTTDKRVRSATTTHCSTPYPPTNGLVRMRPHPRTGCIALEPLCSSGFSAWWQAVGNARRTQIPSPPDQCTVPSPHVQ